MIIEVACTKWRVDAEERVGADGERHGWLLVTALEEQVAAFSAIGPQRIPTGILLRAAFGASDASMLAVALLRPDLDPAVEADAALIAELADRVVDAVAVERGGGVVATRTRTKRNGRAK